MKKSMWLILAIILFAAPFLSCLPGTPTEITGKICQRVSFSQTIYPTNSPVLKNTEYHIAVEIKNNSANALVFKGIDLKAMPEGKEPVSMTMIAEKYGIIEIRPQEKGNFSFFIDVSTGLLPAGSKERPILLQITLRTDSDIVAGPFIALLPDSKTIPFCDDNGKSVPLIFTFKNK